MTRLRPHRLVGPIPAVALVLAALGGLGLLFFRAGDPRRGLAQSTPDALAVAYLQAMVDQHPGDAGTRCRLARAQLALGLYRDAERTLAPLLGRDTTAEPELLGVDAAAAAWRAAPPGSPERAAAGAKVLERLETLLQLDPPTPDEFDHLAKVAREMGRNDLAARAHESAAALDRPRCARWLSEAARDDLAAGDQRSAASAYERAYDCSGDAKEAMTAGLDALDAYLAADMAEEAMGLADRLVERFPREVAVLQRAEAIALGRGDPERARRLGARLVEMGLSDSVSLGRQLDLDLAAGDLGEALRVAERLAALAPKDARAQLTAAKVATWAGRSDLALRHYLWLARNRGDPRDADQALALARALGDASAEAELLTARSRREPLPPAALAEMARALEKSGPPGGAAAALKAYARRHPGRRYAWEDLAAQQERDRDLAAAAATWHDVSRRFGGSPTSAVHLASLEWQLGRPRDALAELRRWTGSAGPSEVEYWRLLAELAWDEEVDDVARLAYRALWNGGGIDPAGAERLLLLSRDAGLLQDVIRYGSEGWARTRQPRLLLLAMDEAARAGRWADLERMAEEAAHASNAFASFPSYWLLWARIAERARRVPEAVESYRRALAVDPRSAAARSGVIWLLAGSHDREALSRCLAAWEVDARDDPALWRAYAAGLEELGLRREALTFYGREAMAAPGDAGAVKRLAEALGRAGERAEAAELDAFLTARVPVRPSPASAAGSPDEAWAVAGAPGAEPDDMGTARRESGRIRSHGAAVGAEVKLESMGPVVLQQERAAATSQALGAELEARVAFSGFTSRDPTLQMPGEETELLARASFDALGGRNEVSGGASLRTDGDVPRASLAHARDLASFATMRLEASLDEPADESAAMRVEAVRSRLGGAVALTGRSVYGRGGFDWKSWSTRAGAALGTGGAASLEAGWLTQGAALDARVRLQGGYQRNQATSGSAADALAAFAPGAPILPAELATLGLGAGATRWAVGPARLLADGWVGWIWPPVRPAYRANLGVSIAPFASGELSLAGFAATDRWDGGGDYGVSLTLTQGFFR